MNQSQSQSQGVTLCHSTVAHCATTKGGCRSLSLSAFRPTTQWQSHSHDRTLRHTQSAAPDSRLRVCDYVTMCSRCLFLSLCLCITACVSANDRVTATHCATQRHTASVAHSCVAVATMGTVNASVYTMSHCLTDCIRVKHWPSQ